MTTIRRTLLTDKFDPGRKQNHAPVDLADQHDNTLYTFYTPGPASINSPEMSQAQYPGPRSAAATSESGGAGGYGYGDNAGGNVSRGPSSASTGGFAGYGAGGGQGYNPTALGAMPEASNYVTGAGADAGQGYGYGAAGAGAAALGAGVGAGAGAAMSAKQREAYNERQRQHQAQQAYGQAAGGSGSGGDRYGASSPSEQTTVAQDGGRFADDEVPAGHGGEIPPT